ncbi:class II aldolase/adducin family protein [Nisaea acidiphila]|uniref:Class II aldolase/adducin family protein n=1 Tax=Nisaea acidiphila TaxID=1862145 RepID=A0A9J7AQN2_9PROT|nr:class II aldolase/adducin family protein [Nisaea acidiphila]UUX49704.1 class II aldolase/adducin family protein [Nisaea acidiphila]
MAKRMGAAERALRQEVIDTCLKMNELGLNQGTSGNVSVRVSEDREEGFFLTPSSIRYDRLRPEDIVRMDLKGEVEGKHKPSSEWRFHLDIMKAREDAGAIVHTHGMFATTLACLHREIPAFHYMIALFGGPTIRCAPYATYGTQELSDHALKALEGRKACLLGNHGLIVLGPHLERALALTVEAETLAAMYWRALQIGQPAILPDEEIEKVAAKFGVTGYGGR